MMGTTGRHGWYLEILRGSIVTAKPDVPKIGAGPRHIALTGFLALGKAQGLCHLSIGSQFGREIQERS